jgi:hypothetical protein
MEFVIYVVHCRFIILTDKYYFISFGSHITFTLASHWADHARRGRVTGS